VRPLGWPLEKVRGLAGAVQLGAQDLALLLHVPDLVEQFREGAGRFVPHSLAPSAREVKRRVLVVDDSVITRQLERRILEGLGFDVDLAVDGQDALRILEQGAPPALILTDVEMPRLDGLGLVRKVRKEQKLKEIPIVIVSTRGAEEDKRAGLEAGADAYIVKSMFEERTLRETIERLLD
jgi:CheY-like chemotaxis protein